MSRIGDQVKRFRIKFGLSQEELAMRIDCARNTISAIERGKSMPSYGIVEMIATAMGIPMVELVGGEPKVPYEWVHPDLRYTLRRILNELFVLDVVLKKIDGQLPSRK